MSMIDVLLGRWRVVVMENERALLFRNGQIAGILGPGEHWLDGRPPHTEIVKHDIRTPEFSSTVERAVLAKVPAAAAEHLEVFRTARGEVAVIERDGQIHAVLGPERKLVVWKEAGPWKAETIDVSADLSVDPVLLRRLGQARRLDLVVSYALGQHQAGLLFIDGNHAGTLTPGVYGFWEVGKAVQVSVVDMRRQPVDVTGQEMLTRDRVTIRVNISADYRVVDPVRAVCEVKDFADALYRALQHAFRKTIGALSLDQILERKVTIDDEAAAKVRADMAAIGVEVFDIALKDVILPGEMREILNQVVAAEKQAEANVIRRREETNATRSLLNTAKVMAENPVMLRLKELEALEAIAGKVERLTVHSGTGGLLNDLVKLRD